jgi:hypothetical protein
MLVKVMAVLCIMLMVAFHDLPIKPGSFLQQFNKDTTSEETIVEGLELEKQIIIWYRLHDNTFPPSSEQGGISTALLMQMGLDTSLAGKATYTYDNNARTFDLSMPVGTSTWHSPHSGIALGQ